ncbi:alanyl-tRNA editing protein [Shimia sp.]|uniref:alanyl-tRNA editing protein n=1 Tax=Shimia sp. TaxID=1954381 RepID=UPI0035699810
MTALLFRDDPYLRDAMATVTAHTPEGAVVLDRSLFYPTGHGQPGDSGALDWPGGRLGIATTVASGPRDLALVPAEAAALPPVGAHVRQRLDWARRHRHMRVHTALHLLSVTVALPVTGAAVDRAGGRVDFDVSGTESHPFPDPAALSERLNRLIAQDLVVRETWAADAAPDLCGARGGRPPVRMIEIGAGQGRVDLQACGGTHVARSSEIGRVRIGRIEDRGLGTRRVHLYLDD